MSIYAHVYNNEIIEFKEIDDALYQSWVASDNPKKIHTELLYTQINLPFLQQKRLMSLLRSARTRFNKCGLYETRLMMN